MSSRRMYMNERVRAKSRWHASSKDSFQSRTMGYRNAVIDHAFFNRRCFSNLEDKYRHLAIHRAPGYFYAKESQPS